MSEIQLNSRAWSIQRTAAAPSGGRRSLAPASSGFPAEFLAEGATIAEEFTAQPGAAVRRGAAPAGGLDFSCDLAEDEVALLAIRHASGALTFHLPVESTRRGAGRSGQARFVVNVRSAAVDTGRRGLFSEAIKAIVIKVGKVALDKAVSFTLPLLAAAFEKAIWSKLGLAEGWLEVTRETLAAGQLAPLAPSSTDRSLLFIHGTFSNAASAFRDLASTGLFDRVAGLYGDRIYAFDHFSVSRTPEENARMLLEGLPDKAFSFDVITHSRGGLVLRNLVERAAAFGPLARRFTLGRAVLVASPNEGTPLVTPARWQDTVGWVANLLELFPDNPFTTGAAFVANGLVWFAQHASGDLPGLHAMIGGGPSIAGLQAPPGPPADAYSALVANFNPDSNVLQRMVDVGVDQFFGSANDLVVPTEGGWRVDGSGVAYIPDGRIGCFGPGGNLASGEVTHLNFFSQLETTDFLVTALSGQAQTLAPVDHSKSLPDRRLLRSAGVEAATPAAGRGPAVAPMAAPAERLHRTISDGRQTAVSDTFDLVVMPRSDSDKHHSQILAHYGSARVLEDFYLGGTNDNAGQRWRTIIAFNERIRDYVNGNVGQMLSPDDLLEFGRVLFETLFPGSIRRLYDTARSVQRSERLNVILTSAIPWVADKPWEFSYDPVRKTSLATSDLHFIRNVMTAVPAEIIDDRQRLRILVASSQPLRLGKLSIEEEEAVIRRGFEPLREAGLADVDVLARATPASLHGYLCTGRYSIVHFIGHGAYDAAADRGSLIFQDEQGNPYPVNDRSAREILCGRGVRLIFLNACETGQGGHADFNSGIAPALVAGGVPIVVANQYKVLDTSATFFAQHFYWSLARGLRLAEAVREARIAVNYSLTGDSIDWAVPVVYARDPNSRLSPERPMDVRTTPSPAVRPSARRSVAAHEVRVAVWDTSSQFPDLRSTLERINAAQTVFGFEIVDLSIPVDAWHIHDGERYLDADRFRERLAPQISQLGVHYISAIIDEPMVSRIAGNKPVYDVHASWPAQHQPPILIFSTKALGLEPTGPATDRAVANAAVENIAGYLMASGSHGEGAKGSLHCPMYFNPKRRLDLLTGRQRLCAACSRKLRKAHPNELKALNAILAAFDQPQPFTAPKERPRAR